MSHFASLSYIAGTRRITVHLELSGRTEVVVFAHDGAEIDRRTDDIDERDSHRLITDLFSVVSTLPPHSEGDYFIEIGDGAQSQSYSASQYDLSQRGLEVAKIVSAIANDMLSDYEQSSKRAQGGPRDKKAGVFGTLKWAVFFALALTGSVIGSELLTVVGFLTGPLAFSIGVVVRWFLPSVLFYGVGQKFGEEYRGNSEVLYASVLGAVTPMAILFVANGIGDNAVVGSLVGVWMLGVAIVLQFAAKFGERAGY